MLIASPVRPALREARKRAGDAVAREHGISRGAIRTAIADLLANQPAPAATAAQPLRVEVPGKVAATSLTAPTLGDAEWHALRHGRCPRPLPRSTACPHRLRGGDGGW